ncbi:response regulator transcription factor [Jeongeupia sp. USM3]|uniref:response regulator transcription factor n=1 Tax=Jeongeupia sp. USM3 TaxID=1906741 RepID=UPI00089E079F|nr:response regulator transcription factor [Jeongeupia sp. USM3]AOY02135.1 hypothetical protein BJP62_00505 [Jeongeupia sp. USM3]
MNFKVAVIDDHPLIVHGVCQALADMTGVEVCSVVGNSSVLAGLIERERPELLICDFYMPGGALGDGLSLIAWLQAHHPALKLVILTMMSNPPLLEGILNSGVHGLLLKTGGDGEIRSAVQAVAAGGRYVGEGVWQLLQAARLSTGDSPADILSARELEVLRLCVSGLTVSEIAALLHRSVKTISHQKISAQQKLGIANPRELYEYALHHGILNRQ